MEKKEEKISWSKKAPDLSFMKKSLSEYLEVTELVKKDLIERKAALVRALKETR